MKKKDDKRKAEKKRKKEKTQFMTPVGVLEDRLNHVWIIGVQMREYHVFLMPHF